MYKKGGIIMLIGLGIIIFAAVIIMLNFSVISNAIMNSDDNKGEIVTKDISAVNLNSFKLDTRNDKVKFIKTDSDKVEIRYKETKQKKYDLTIENGVIVIRKEKEKIKFFNFDLSFLFEDEVTQIKIPEKLIKNMELINSNTEIFLEDYDLKNLNVTTSNGKIILKNITVENPVNFSTSNATINLDVFKSPNIKANSSNGSIELYNSNTNSLKANTSNSSIIIKNSVISDNLDIVTSNGNINLENIDAKDIYAKTSNSTINLDLNAIRGEYNENFRTSNSVIKINGDSFQEKSFNRNFDGALKNVELRTSNGAITIDYKN